MINRILHLWSFHMKFIKLAEGSFDKFLINDHLCNILYVYVPVPGGETAPDGGFSTMMMMMLGWLVMATALFLLRPSRLRNQGDGKPANNVCSYATTL